MVCRTCFNRFCLFSAHRQCRCRCIICVKIFLLSIITEIILYAKQIIIANHRNSYLYRTNRYVLYEKPLLYHNNTSNFQCYQVERNANIISFINQKSQNYSNLMLTNHTFIHNSGNCILQLGHSTLSTIAYHSLLRN